jgi:outer membrane protein TolC
MYKLIKYTFLLSLLTAHSAMMKAQTVRNLSLNQAIELGLQNSKQLAIANGKVAVMKSRVAQIKNMLIPSVNASVNYTRISDNVEPFKVQFSPTAQPVSLNPQILDQSYNRLGVQAGLFTGFRAINTLKSTQYLEQAAQLDAEKDKADIRLNVINAYYNYFKLIASKQILEENLQRFDHRLTDTKLFLNQGIALQNDVLKLELHKANLQQNIVDVQGAIDIATFNLALMLGLATDTKINLNESLRTSSRTIAQTDELIIEALQNRYEIKANQYRQQASKKAIEISKSYYYPVINAGANYDYNLPNQRVFPQENAFKGTWFAGITASYNLVNLYSAKDLVREQKVNYQQTMCLNAMSEDAVKMDVNANASAYHTALQKITLANKSIDQATENQRIMQTRYTNQIATLTDLLEADALFSQAQLNLINANADAEIAYAKLQKSIGK